MNLPFLQPLKAEAFPTFDELVEKDRATMGSPAPKPRAAGLFESLLGNPGILHAALLENPDAYDPRLLPLIVQMLNGRKLETLTPEELALLDAGTIELAQHRRQPKPLPAPQGRAPTKSSEPDDADTADGDERDLEWNGGRGQRFNPPGPSTKILNEQALGAVPTRWWDRR